MNNNNRSILRMVSFPVLLGVLTGCVGYVDSPPRGAVYVPPPPVIVQAPVIVQEEYVYYPSHQVYYSSRSRQYIYQDGPSWVSRPAPANVSVEMLYRSPSVRVPLHGEPSHHHATIVRQYPKHWTPSGGHGEQYERRDEGRNSGNRGRD